MRAARLLTLILLVLPGCGPSQDYVSQYQDQLKRAVAAGDKPAAQDALTHLSEAARPAAAASAPGGSAASAPADPVAQAAQSAIDQYAAAVAKMPDAPVANGAPATTGPIVPDVSAISLLHPTAPDKLNTNYDGARPHAASPAASALEVPPPYKPVAAAALTGTPQFQQAVREAEQDLAQGDFAAALLKATQAKDLDPKSPWPALVRAQASARLGNFSSAVEEAEKALSLQPDNAQALRTKAYAEIALGRFSEAVADLDKALSLEPGDAAARFYRGAALESLGRLNEAVADYDQAALLDPALKPVVEEALSRLRGAAPTPSAPPENGGWPLKLLAALALGIPLLLLAAAKALRRKSAPPSAFTLPAASRAPELKPDALVGQTYRVVSEIGRGGMGVVYEALDLALQRRVALKRLNRGPENEGADLERLLREARLVAKLRHPNLAAIYNVVHEDDLYLVFEFVEGVSLDKTLSRGRRLDRPSAVRALSQVCAAVAYAHEQRIIHRDLKPSNVMMTPQGDCKVMDFGIAHQASAEQTRTAVSGSPPYMAPEQSLGSVSKASDVYALGVMAYEMLTGQRPFDGPDYLDEKLRARFTPPSRIDAALPAALDGFFARALDPDPTKRFASASEFDASLRKACA